VKAQQTSPDKKKGKSLASRKGELDGPRERDDRAPENDGCAEGEPMDAADDKTSNPKSKGPPAGLPPKHQPPGGQVKVKPKSQFALKK
jgi:hypothetical protein